MARDEKEGKVESYKLTPQMATMLGRYKKLKRVEGMLRYGTEVEKRKFESLRDMWQSLQMETMKLEQGMPGEPLRELEGMDFQEEERVKMGPETRIQY
uniref:Uncharacterized protein n=1 Tax=viral metagenome TaxID=1070528 RepID=A0A6H1ZBI9_9ZZZZ